MGQRYGQMKRDPKIKYEIITFCVKGTILGKSFRGPNF